ncbi:hypothetical protein GY45DRAFT_865356 [Cubamyces sp. BRFM 1775]|nr:hypothetical protein GY45DRAFT_865356 [Cubamyces sp. BRFM 1775]
MAISSGLSLGYTRALSSPSCALRSEAILDHAIRSSADDAHIYGARVSSHALLFSPRSLLLPPSSLSAMSSLPPSPPPPLPPSPQALSRLPASSTSSMLVQQAFQLSTSAAVNALPSSSGGVPALHAIDAMANSRLPIDVCERAIDNIAPSRPGNVLACALTCKAWTPRSLYVLYSRVRFNSPRRASLLLESLARYPERAAWTKELRVGWNSYMPLGLLLSPALLRNCEEVMLYSANYSALYIDRVVKPLLSLHCSISCLILFWDAGKSSLNCLCSLLSALPRLQTLWLSIDHHARRMKPWEIRKWNKLVEKGVYCKSLKELLL